MTPEDPTQHFTALFPGDENEIQRKVIAARGVVYGEPHRSHENIGLAWTGLIQQHYGIALAHPIPPWLAELMLASFKIHRSARVFHADNFVDCRAYLSFAQHGQENPGVPYPK